MESIDDRQVTQNDNTNGTIVITQGKKGIFEHMANIEWEKLNKLQVGRYGEYFAKMEFTAYGFDVYSSEVDDHGVDFIAKNKVGDYFEVQVKTICKSRYTYVKKDKVKLDDKHIIAFLRLRDNEKPEMYVFPATVWNNPNDVFKNRKYEWGFNYSDQNRKTIEQYLCDRVLPKLFESQGKYWIEETYLDKTEGE